MRDAIHPRAIGSSVLNTVPVQLNGNDGQTEFRHIETVLGVKFEMSSCLCDESSDNSKHCTRGTTLVDYLQSDLSGHAILLIVPARDAFKIMKHRFDCKSRAPATTSACRIVPKHYGRRFL